MISKFNNYLFIVEDILYGSFQQKKEWIKFINKIPINKRYFFTLNCDISKKTLSAILLKLNISYDFNNILTPSYLILDYCKNLYHNLNIYPISHTMDFNDFYLCNVKINFTNPNLLVINTSNISQECLTAINSFEIPVVFSSNLCPNRFDKCVLCNSNCSLKHIRSFYRNRLVIPDLPPYYNTLYLFKKFNIEPRETVLVTTKIRNTYLESQKNGCIIAFILNNKDLLNEYIESPFDIDIVVDNLDNLSYLLNLKEET